MEIRIAKSDELKEICNLNLIFVKENCCNNIMADSEEYYANKKIFVAIEKGRIIGYAYGDFLKETNLRSYAAPNEQYFELEEMYVLPEFRNKKIGQKLFKELERYARKNGAKTLRLNAVSKNYKSLLNFYIDVLGMEFISAFLIKKLDSWKAKKETEHK